MRGLLLAIGISLIVTALPSAKAAPLDVGGAWKLNRQLTGVPEQDTGGRGPGGRRGPDGGPGGGGRGGPGGRGGGRGGGGRGGGGMGRGGGGGGLMGRGGPNDGDMRKMEAVRSRMTEIADRLIIVHDGSSVSITDGNGRRISLKADDKKQQQVTGDGEFKTKTHFEGWKLIVEEDFGGPKVITTYTPTLEGGEIRRLEVVVKAEGERVNTARPSLTRIYDSENAP